MKKTIELLQKINAKHEEVMRMKDAGDISGALKAADELNKLKAEYDVEKSIEDSIPTAGKPVEKPASNGDINMLCHALNKKILKRTGVNVGSMTDEEMELSKKFNNVSNITTQTLLNVWIVERKPNSSLNKRKSLSCLLGEAFCGVCRVVFTWLLYHILAFFVIH